MNEMTLQRQACRLFADLLSYPGAGVGRTARSGAVLLADRHPESAAHLRSFGAFADEHPATELEEIYTATFDLQPSCIPYVGFLLCGEGRQRTFFMMQLQELYRRHGFACGRELPDHLSEVLRFVGEVPDEAVAQELIGDGLLPALEKLAAGFGEERHPYIDVLKGLQAFLASDPAMAVQPQPGDPRQEVTSCEI